MTQDELIKLAKAKGFIGHKVTDQGLRLHCWPIQLEDFAEAVRDDALSYDNEFSRLKAAAELAFGLLWMIDTEHPAHWAARAALKSAFGDDEKECIRRGIKAAIDAGFEADHPEGCQWWAGKKGGDDESD